MTHTAVGPKRLLSASGEFLIAQGRLVADNVEGVIIRGSGNWLIDEAP